MSFLNSAYGDVKVINESPDVKWISDMAEDIKRDPSWWNKQIDYFRSQSHNRIDNTSYEECVKGEGFLQGKGYCLLSIAKVTKNVNPLLAHPLFSNPGYERMGVYTVASVSGHFEQMIDKINWGYVCVAVAPIASYFIVGLFNPATALPAAIAAGTSAFICLLVNKRIMGGRMDKVRDEISGGIDQLKEDNRLLKNKVERLMENDRKLMENDQRLRDEIDKIKGNSPIVE